MLHGQQSGQAKWGVVKSWDSGAEGATKTRREGKLKGKNRQ